MPTSTAIMLSALAKGPNQSPESQTGGQERCVQKQQCSPRTGHKLESPEQQHYGSQHRNEDRHRQQWPDLAESAGDVMRRRHHKVAGDVGGK
ncbi:MAG TPA: hypothetical protein VHZ55_31065 [Bryobacteraceae bacterium]|nr:hypothetical protein [Bryobacteraceae bacterium]